MLDEIIKVKQTNDSSFEFSVLIPTWNNLKYLQLCIEGLRVNSFHNVQKIVIINEGNDGTLDWVKAQKDIDYVYAPQNIGICYALNIARSLISAEYVVYMNDDMYALPEWDLVIMDEIKKIPTKAFMLSSTMIEPYDSGNKCVVVKDFGDSLDSFRKDELLQNYKQYRTADWSGSTWPPNVLHIDTWDIVGGMSIEFSPGMGSDPDLSKKCYEAGVRIFKGVGNSLVYHFGMKSTGRVNKNRGREQFMQKWGITQRTFCDEYLRRGDKYQEVSNEQKSKSFLSKIIVAFKIMKSYL